MRHALCAALVFLAALAVGCGNSDKAETVEAAPMAPREEAAAVAPQEVWVTLDGSPGPANAAVQVAIDQGFFAEAGLTVQANSPLIPNRPVRYVSSATDNLGLAQQPQVLVGKGHGAPIVAVGSLVSQPTAAMIWLRKSGIRGIADLKGKTIATPGIPYQEDLLASILRRAGIGVEDVQVKRTPYKLVPTLLKGKADAIFGGSWNIEGVALREMGAKPTIRRVQELGVPRYDEVMVIARTDWAKKESRTLRAFMAALARATALMVEDPEVAVQAIEEKTSDIGRNVLKAQVRATLPLLSRSGRFDPERTDKLLTWMRDEGMIRRRPSISDLFTNRYLHGS